MSNLWGFQPEALSNSTPKEIIDEQADMLGKITSDMVSAKVVELEKNPFIEKPSNRKEFSFDFNFIVEARYLPNYKLKLFKIGFNIPVYPLYILVNAELNKELQPKYDHIYFVDGYMIESEAEFLNILKLILSRHSSKTYKPA
jgi:hypothetical protein